MKRSLYFDLVYKTRMYVQKNKLLVPSSNVTLWKFGLVIFSVVVQELTGRLPDDYPLLPGEKPPQIRRRIGAAFKLDEQSIPQGAEV